MTLSEIIWQPEGRRLEFKESLPKVSELAKTIVAFANDAGGELYLGVSNQPRKLTGLPEDDLLKLEEQISNLIFEHCSPVILPEIIFLTSENKHLIRIKIHRGNNLPYFLKKKGKLEGTYIRVGSTNRQANEEIISELERQRRNISFDSEPVFHLTLNEIVLSEFKYNFRERTGEDINRNVLKKSGLIKELNGQDYSTNGCILLSDNPAIHGLFPYAKIECARFKGHTSDVFIDQKTFDGSIVNQAELAYEFVIRHINKGATVKGVYTESRWEYPVKAVRETIRNAVVHRDYSLTGKDIKVAVYDDMVEITSPGKLLPSIDFSRMEDRQSDIRNKVIAAVFKQLGIIDQWGNGLKLIAEELKAYPEIDFRWFDQGMQFQIQFVNKKYLTGKEKSNSVKENQKTTRENSLQNFEIVQDTVENGDKKNTGNNIIATQKTTLKSTLKKTSIPDKIIHFIKKDSTLTIDKMAAAIGNITSDGIKYHLKKLVAAGKIRHEGPDKGGYWKVTD